MQPTDGFLPQFVQTLDIVFKSDVLIEARGSLNSN